MGKNTNYELDLIWGARCGGSDTDAPAFFPVIPVSPTTSPTTT